MVCINVSTISGQNYLYQKDVGGFSGYVNYLSKLKQDNSAGFIYGADYTYNGIASLGIKGTRSRSRTYVFDEAATGFLTLNLSATPLKSKIGNTTYSIPLVTEISFYEGQGYFSYGVRLSALKEVSLKTSLLYVFSMVKEPSFTYSGINSFSFTFEPSLMYRNARIAPLVSIFDQKVRLGFSAGFLLKNK